MSDKRFGTSRSLVTPLYPSAVYAYPDLDALDQVMEGIEPGFVYARDGHPNAHSLAEKLTKLETGKWGLICGSGMAAITASILANVTSGGRILASQQLYGRSLKLFKQELTRFGVSTQTVDCSDLDAVRNALQVPASLLFVETISNPLMRALDIPELARIAHEHGAKLIVDNTFATPVLFRPLEHGADLSIESLTKLIGGHSDFILGGIFGNDLSVLPTMTDIVSTWGLAASPFDCWQCERGLSTLSLRVRAATENASLIATWLAGHTNILKLNYPGSADHPDYKLVRKLMPHGCGAMMCFELKGGRVAVNRLMQRSRIPFSPSLGHVTTTLSHPSSTSHRYESSEDKERQGITDGLIRLSVGCEPLDEIQMELARGLAS